MSKEKTSIEPDSGWNPLTTFIFAESTLAVTTVQAVHQSLAGLNRTLKSNITLSSSQLELALDLINLNVSRLTSVQARPYY